MKRVRYLQIALAIFLGAALIFTVGRSKVFRGEEAEPAEPWFSYQQHSPHFLSLKTACQAKSISDASLTTIFGNSSNATKAYARQLISKQCDLTRINETKWLDNNTNPTNQVFFDLGQINVAEKGTPFEAYVNGPELNPGEEQRDSMHLHDPSPTCSTEEETGNEQSQPSAAKHSNQVKLASAHLAQYAPLDDNPIVPYGSDWYRLPGDCNKDLLNIPRINVVQDLWNYCAYNAYPTSYCGQILHDPIDGQKLTGVNWQVPWLINADQGVPADAVEFNAETPSCGNTTEDPACQDGHNYFSLWKSWTEIALGAIKNLVNSQGQKLMTEVVESPFRGNPITSPDNEETELVFANKSHFSWLNHFGNTNTDQVNAASDLDSLMVDAAWLPLLKTNSPNLSLVTSIGQSADNFTTWQDCNSFALRNRLLGNLAYFYLTKDPNQDSYFTSSSSGCGINDDATSLIYTQASATLPLAVSYNVGQPTGALTQEKFFNINGHLAKIFSRTFEKAKIYLRPLDQANLPISQRDESSVDSSNSPSSLSPTCFLRADGSIDGPFDKLTLYAQDSAFAVGCPSNLNQGFDVSQPVNPLESTSLWSSNQVDKNTYLKLKAIPIDYSTQASPFEGNLNNREVEELQLKKTFTNGSNTIKFTSLPTINLPGCDLAANSTFELNKVGLDSQACPEFANLAAQVTIKNDTKIWTDPIIVDENGQECTTCTNLAYSITGNEVTFNVSHFSYFSVAEKDSSGDRGLGDDSNGGDNNGPPPGETPTATSPPGQTPTPPKKTGSSTGGSSSTPTAIATQPDESNQIALNASATPGSISEDELTLPEDDQLGAKLKLSRKAVISIAIGAILVTLILLFWLLLGLKRRHEDDSRR